MDLPDAPREGEMLSVADHEAPQDRSVAV